ncbi:hypothetical protein TNCT_530121 [Trichonephila clavata]|uniref:Uncharacterized protein n=1 Tax=Trichonephila clavata TaxID=2740835 RepID=A0A8X6FP54_TRICU|nr:hypothetical protein TNCT_530121 [Trichonephila clavata]
MDLCINASIRRILINMSNTKDEIYSIVQSLITRAERTETAGERVHRNYRTSSFAFCRILGYEFWQQRSTDDKFLFSELRSSQERLRKLMKSMKFLQDRRKNDTVNMFGILGYVRSFEFKLSDLIVDNVEKFDRTIWLLEVLLHEIETANAGFLERIKGMKEQLNIQENLGLIEF